MHKLIILLTILLTGCSQKVDVDYINKAVLDCKSHGGLKGIRTNSILENKVICKDGTVLLLIVLNK